MFDFSAHYENIRVIIEKYKTVCSCVSALQEEAAHYQKQKSELFARFGTKYGNVRVAEVRNYSEEELLKVRMELANSVGILALIKSTLGFGKSQKEVYKELMGKINGLLNYMDCQIRDKQSETVGFLNRIYELSEEYSKEYKKLKSYCGCNPDSDWSSYEQPEMLHNRYIFLGDELRDIFSNEKDEQCISGENRAPLFKECRKAGFLRIPWGIELDQPIQLCIEYPSARAEDARNILQALLYQMLRSMPKYYAEFHFIDAVTSCDDIKEFLQLQQVRKQDIEILNRKITGGRYQLAKSYLNNDDISAAMEEFKHWGASIVNEKAAYSTLTDYNNDRGNETWIPYQILVVHNLQQGFSDNDIKQLQYLIENGNNLGVSVIILNNIERWKADSYSKKTGLQSCFSPEAMRCLTKICLNAANIQLQTRSANTLFEPWRVDSVPAEFIQQVIVALVNEKKLNNRFEAFFHVDNPFGQMDSTNGLHIPFAITSRGKIMEYFLGQKMNAHGLICGGTGSGKSSLLHMLISSIVMNYSPDDIELWLADYKITEFSTYKSNTPPHIGFIGLSKTADFSYAFLDKILAEMNRRQNLITEADEQYKMQGRKDNITSFEDFRKVNGRTSMKRLLIIIDEFHVMSQHAQAEAEYKIKLENILSEARALGVSLLLSDQAIVDGLRGLSDKGKKQIKARIALSNYMDELKETLNVTDNEQLLSFIHMKVGEVAVQTVVENEDRQEIATIERATAIYIDGVCRYNVNEKARALYGVQNYEADVFDDRIVEKMCVDDIEEWEKHYLRPRRDGSKDLHIYIGRPVNLDFALHFPLLQRKGNNIMAASGSEEQQMRIMKAIIASFSRQQEYEIIIMADTLASVYREYEPEIRSLANEYSSLKVLDQIEDICYELNRILGYINTRSSHSKILLVWLGLDSMADMLEEETETKPAYLLSLSRGGTLQDMKNRVKEPGTVGEISAENEEPFVDETTELFDALFGDDLDNLEYDGTGTLPEVQTEYPNILKDGIYNARADIAKVVHLGPINNIFNFVIYDSASALRDFREVRTADFNHKIAFAMSDYEAGEFLDQPRLIRDLSEGQGYYHNGRNGRRFIPYGL